MHNFGSEECSLTILDICCKLVVLCSHKPFQENADLVYFVCKVCEEAVH